MIAGPADERVLVEAASAGDEDAFATLVAPYRGAIHGHCRRILHCEHDAEDACQETLLRAWRAIGRFERRSSLRSWLYRIATNTSLSLIEKRATRDAVFTTVWSVDGVDLVDEHCDLPDELCERREAAGMALRVASELLSPKQASALLMREVYGFTAGESARRLGTSEVSVNSALQRARAKLDAREPVLYPQPPHGYRSRQSESRGADRVRFP